MAGSSCGPIKSSQLAYKVLYSIGVVEVVTKINKTTACRHRNLVAIKTAKTFHGACG